MKMDSLGKTSSTASSARSSGVGVGNGPTDGVLAREAAAARLRETAHFANIMVEFENNDREMAVDVPDSFIAHAKTPPKYPPPYRANGTLPSSGSGRSLPGQNGLHHHRHGSLNSSASPPPALNSRDHLRIERDGHLRNTKEGPSLPNRGSYGHNSSSNGSGFRKPTEQESLRIKKYSEEIMRKNLESERRERHEEFLRQSLRNSQRLGALKERHRASPAAAGVNNSALDNSQQRHPQQQPVPDVEALNKALRRLEIAGVLVGDGAEALKAIVHSNDFQSSLTFNQKVSRRMNDYSLSIRNQFQSIFFMVSL